MTGTHVPACLNLDAHIDAAVREAAGTSESLESFVARVRADWQSEQLMADMDDIAVISYWAEVERDFQRLIA
jgi:hypothetical protein